MSASEARNPANPLPFHLSVCAREEVDGFRCEGVTHLLSIDDPGERVPTPDWLDGVHEQLNFHDLELDHPGAVLPDRDVLERILMLGAECSGLSVTRPVHLLIHCRAGRRRSTAAAYAVAARELGPGRESEALAWVRDMRPQAFPNLLMVREADELLKRDGELVLALQPMRNDPRWGADSPESE